MSSSDLTLGEGSSVRPELQSQAHHEEILLAHDIFLSHSGAQKGFVKGLYKLLCPLYSTFFDITHHSLPPGENFPTHIFYAAKRCKLAVVVLSEQFVSSKWPMLELSAFVEAIPSSVKILPLFYDLSPADFKCKDNLDRWYEKWQTFAARDRRIIVSAWGNALREVCSIGGLIFDTSEGEAAFLDKIVSCICESVPPTIKCDDTGIFGKDRLCEVILNRFKEMEPDGEQIEHCDKSLPAPQPKPCVLGMYGLPGSGKSTLSRFLQQHFFDLYGRKALYLQFPTNPSPTDLINMFKKLLKLTDSRQSINLDEVSHLRMVYSLLKAHNLQKSRVFLVMDNVNDKSVKAVKDILEVGVGPGSKVLLVARSLDVLQPVLLLGKEGQYFISASMCVPRISEAEATGILLHTLGATMTPSQSLVDVVRICGFGSCQADLLYLPLVMEIMGSLLMRYGEDVEKLTNALSKFRKKVKTYKEDAVKELVGTSFKELGDEELQLLFLDVTLFIVPLKLGSVEKACDLLRFLYACSPERMATKIKDLQRHCFLRIDYNEITVHDVYVEFAESIQEDFNFRLLSSAWRWRWMTYKCAGAEVGREVVLRQEHTASDDQQVRTMIVEVGEGCERVEVYGFAGLKALVVRNCKSLAVLGLAGLTSLVIIDIQNCPCMSRLDSTNCDYSKVKRLSVQEEKSTMSTLQVQRMIAAIRLQSPPRFFEGLASHMKGLQVLRLEHTGIKRLVDMSSCWPQLRELYVEEYHLEAFKIGSLRRLNCIKFRDRKYSQIEKYRGSIEPDEEKLLEPDEEKCVLYENEICENPRMKLKGMEPGEEKVVLYENEICEKVVWRNSRKKLEGMDLMKECPELEEVFIESAFFEERHVSSLTPKVHTLKIQMHFALKLPDLTRAALSLEKVRVELCAKLERVDFFVKFERLTILELSSCSSLVEVTGLGFLHNLRRLEIMGCPSLLILEGFNNLRMLESFEVWGCSELREIPSWNHLIRLKQVLVHNCQKLCKIPSLMGLSSLEEFGLLACANVIVWAIADLCAEPASESKHEGTCNAELQVLPLCSNRPDHLCTLQKLKLTGLQKLRGVPGIQSLIHLRELYLQECPQLEELLPLHGLVELRFLVIRNCGKLKAVEGCDEMKSLKLVELVECTSLECFVFRDLYTFWRGRQTGSSFFLVIDGCKFATMEAMLEWAFDVNLPEVFRRASERFLVDKYRGEGKLQVVSAFFRTLVSKTLLNEDDCFDCDHLMAKLHIDDKGLAAEKLRSLLENMPKKALLQHFESDDFFRVSLINIIDIIHKLNYTIFRVHIWRSTQS